MTLFIIPTCMILLVFTFLSLLWREGVIDNKVLNKLPPEYNFPAIERVRGQLNIVGVCVCNRCAEERVIKYEENSCEFRKGLYNLGWEEIGHKYFCHVCTPNIKSLILTTYD